MKALVLDGAPGSSFLRFSADRPDPVPLPGQAVVRVSLAGICGTDLQLLRGYKGGFRGVPGHEFVGVVESAPGRDDLVGARVVAEINVSCRTCTACSEGRTSHCPTRLALGIAGADGAFAERVLVPVVNLHRVPAGVPDDVAVFAEPVAACARIVVQTRPEPGTRAVVVGDGRLGQLAAQVLRAEGLDVILLGRHPEKLAIAARCGVRTAPDPGRVPRGADLVVEATGRPEGLSAALGLVRSGGTVVLKTTCAEDGPRPVIDWNDLVVREIALLGSRCGPFERALDLLAGGGVDPRPLIDGVYPLAVGAEAFDRAATRGVLKVLLRPEA